MFERSTFVGPVLPKLGCLGTFLLILCLLVSYGLDSPLYGQAAAASISGYVTDQNKAALPDVVVRMTNLDTQIATTARTGGAGSTYSHHCSREATKLRSARKVSGTQSFHV